MKDKLTTVWVRSNAKVDACQQLLVDAAAGDIVIKLPDLQEGAWFIVNRRDTTSHVVTLVARKGQTIAGAEHVRVAIRSYVNITGVGSDWVCSTFTQM